MITLLGTGDRNAATSRSREGCEPWAVRRLRRSDALAEVVETCVHPRAAPPGGSAPAYQVVLVCQGLFRYRAGRRVRDYDVNRVLYAPRGEDYVDTHPVEGLGHRVLVVRPGDEMRHALYGSLSPDGHPAFAAGVAPVGARLRLMTHRLAALLARPDADPLTAGEAIVATLFEALPEPPALPAGPPSRMVDRAKQLLHARTAASTDVAGGASPTARLSLEEVARAVGCSPTWLTREFTRTEGQPLYRYATNLRLNEALVRLPSCDSITALALDLGFCSHAHLTAAFSAAFGLTPSAFRAEARPPRPARTPPLRHAA